MGTPKTENVDYASFACVFKGDGEQNRTLQASKNDARDYSEAVRPPEDSRGRKDWCGNKSPYSASSDAPLLDAASLPLEHRAAYGPPAAPVYGPPPLGGPGPGGPLGGQLGGGGNALGHGDEAWPLATPDMPQIKHLQVQCEKTHMRVNIEFDRPFYGMIFSKGFYSDPHCVHLKPGTGHLSATFEIFLNSCGMSSSGNQQGGDYGGHGPTPSGSYVENTIIVQYDPYVQEVWDQARKLRCTWYDFYEKAVTFRPFQVDMLHAVTANFLGDNLQCWMQIQVGKGPWASEVSGIVKIGQTMTMVLAIKDDESKFDMLVRNCVAHDGKRAPIQLVDQHGCVVRPKIMSRFQKIKNFGPSASVVSFAYFQAFKFPDSMNVHFQCVIQVCRYNCPEPKCGGHGLAALGGLGSEYGAPGLGGGLGSGATISHEYGAPQAPQLHGDYGPPPLGDQYGPPAAYPDPRHPSGPSGAYSEPQENVVPAPNAQAQQGAAPENASTASEKSSQDAQPSQQQQQQQQQTSAAPPQGAVAAPSASGADLNLPPPPLPGQRGTYTTVKRKGGVHDELESNLATLGGRPRSVESPAELAGARRRRETDSFTITLGSAPSRPRARVARVRREAGQEMTDVNTSRTIQVVAPGDVNFALNAGTSSNETVVIQSAQQGGADQEHICMSVPSFVGGLVMLLLVLVVSCLVAAFLFVRVRAIDRKGITTTFGVLPGRGFDNTEYVKGIN
ncbi:Cuticlin-4 [Frankliniella fusca]|uniref:Cuticlin-4 n=1 Tax=Frankliniella fusca TaxID=407009 RepID=A0AAE1L8H5_9NEOP|nr:Cuticlin-4 [Frankliniella fusca]